MRASPAAAAAALFQHRRHRGQIRHPQRTVQDWISNGRIAAVKVGKKYHVDALSVEAYLQQCTQPR